MQQVYLAGAIFEVEDPQSWRNTATGLLAGHCNIVNPIKLEVDTRYYTTLVQIDLRAISECQIALALVDSPSWGTAMELFYARHNNILIVGWYQDKFQEHRSPWLNYCVTQFVHGLENACEDVKDLLQALKEE